MSPASRRACPRSCVAITILTPEAAVDADDVLDAVRRGGIEAGCGLVEEQDLGIAGERARQRQPLLLAARQPARRSVSESLEAHPTQKVGHQRCAPIRSGSAGREGVGDIGGGRSTKHDRSLENHRAAFAVIAAATAPGDRSRGRQQQAHRYADQRALAGTVRADENRGRSRPETSAKCGRGSSRRRAERHVFEHDRQVARRSVHHLILLELRRPAARPRRAH